MKNAYSVNNILVWTDVLPLCLESVLVSLDTLARESMTQGQMGTLNPSVDQEWTVE